MQAPAKAPEPPGTTANLASRMKAAAQLAARHAQRSKVVTITLPAAYKALGRHLYEAKLFRDEFSPIYQEFDRLIGQLQAIRNGAQSRAPAEGIAAKTKSAAASVKDAAQSKSIEMQASQAFRKFGELVFETHGERAAPAELIRPIIEARSEVAALDLEIANLSKVGSGRILIPKRILIAAGVLLGLAILGAITNQQDETAKSTAQSTSGRSPNSEMSQPTAVAQGDKRPARSLAVSSTTFKIRKGMLAGDLELQIAPEVADEIEISEPKWNNSEAQVDFTLKLQPVAGGPTIDPWHFSVYDKDDIKINGGVVDFPSTIETGQRVKASVYVGTDNKAAATRVRIHR